MQRLYTCLLSLSLAIGACLIGVVLFESGLRLFHSQIIEIHPNGMWQLSETRGYQLTSGFDGDHIFTDFKVRITINQQGYRDRAYGPKQPGVFRILTIGDSFTFGFGVQNDEVFSKVLEAKLHTRTTQTTFEVINGGASGYSTHQELIFLKEVGLNLEPDLVLVGLYPHNDLKDNQKPIDRFEIAYGFLYDQQGYEMVRQAEKTGFPIPMKGFLWAYSHSYRFLADRYHKLKFQWTSTPPVEVDNSEESKIEKGSDPLDQQPPLPGEDLEEPYGVDKKTSELFREIAEITRGQGGQAVMLLIPDIKQVANLEPMWKPQWDQLKEMAGLNNMPVIDLMPVFSEAARAGQTPELWYLVNKHWKNTGHRLAAETIYTSLLNQQLIP